MLYATLSPSSHIEEIIHYATLSPSSHVEKRGILCLMLHYHHHPMLRLSIMLHCHHHPILRREGFCVLCYTITTIPSCRERDPMPYHSCAALSPPSQHYTAHHYHPADCVKMGSNITMCSLAGSQTVQGNITTLCSH